MTIRPPIRYEPMMAIPWAGPFSDPGWWFEVKWDGYRTVAYGGADRTELRSRRGNDVGYRFPEVAAMRFQADVVLDGEVVAFDDDGAPSFFLLGAVWWFRTRLRDELHALGFQLFVSAPTIVSVEDARAQHTLRHDPA